MSKLEEIENRYEAPYIMTNETAWLISRVKKLEEACKDCIDRASKFPASEEVKNGVRNLIKALEE